MKMIILAVGKMRGPDQELCLEYEKRVTGKIAIKEITAPNAHAECEKLLTAIPTKAFAIICDEGGKDLSSRELAGKLSSWEQNGPRAYLCHWAALTASQLL